MSYIQLRYTLGLESTDYLLEPEVTEEVANQLEVDYIKSEHELATSSQELDKLQTDISTVSSYHEFIKKEDELDTVTVEAIYIGLDSLLAKHQITTNEVYPSLESWEYNPSGSRAISLETTGNVLTGLKEGIKKAAITIFKKIKEFLKSFLNFFKKVFSRRKKEEVKKAKETLKKMEKDESVVNGVNELLQEESNVSIPIEDLIRDGIPRKSNIPGGSRYRLKHIEYTPGGLIFTISLNEEDKRNILYASLLNYGVNNQDTRIRHMTSTIEKISKGKLQNGLTPENVNTIDELLLYNILPYEFTKSNLYIWDFTLSKGIWTVNQEKPEIADFKLIQVTDHDRIAEEESKWPNIYSKVIKQDKLNIIDMNELLEIQMHILESLDNNTAILEKISNIPLPEKDVLDNKSYLTVLKAFNFIINDYINRCRIASNALSNILEPLAKTGRIKNN